MLGDYLLFHIDTKEYLDSEKILYDIEHRNLSQKYRKCLLSKFYMAN